MRIDYDKVAVEAIQAKLAKKRAEGATTPARKRLSKPGQAAAKAAEAAKRG